MTSAGRKENLVPGAINPKDKRLKDSLWLQVKNIPGGESLKKCIQCGTCTGCCPVSYTMDLTPREVIALLRAGDIESILSSRTIWICASCYACTVRCPQGVLVTDVMYALKRLAIEQDIFPKRFPVYALSKSFVGMLPMFLKLAPKGRIGLLPKKIKSSKQFSEILKEAEIMENIIPM